MSRLAIALALALPSLVLPSLAWAKPSAVSEANLPLRAVVSTKNGRVSNCVFAKQLIPPHARWTTSLTVSFRAGDAIWAHCFLPDRMGGNRPGELTDVFLLDGKEWWTQAYEQAVPAEALERQVALDDVLRPLFSMLARGAHRIEMVGMLKRGGHSRRLYHGEFHYVR